MHTLYEGDAADYTESQVQVHPDKLQSYKNVQITIDDDGEYKFYFERKFETGDESYDNMFTCGVNHDYQWRIGKSANGYQWILDPQDKGTFLFSLSPKCEVNEDPKANMVFTTPTRAATEPWVDGATKCFSAVAGITLGLMTLVNL